MKKVKVLFGSALILLAIAGAFASSKSAGVDNIFYIDDENNCVAGQVTLKCPAVGTPNCVLPILGESLSAQIYQTQTPVSGQPGRFTCSDAYRPAGN